MKTIKEIESQVRTLVEVNARGIEENQHNIKKMGQTIERANADLIASQNEMNTEKYTQAKEELRIAEHMKELYLKQIEKLENVPLLSKQEYNQLLSAITTATDVLHNELNKRAVELLGELKEVSDESLATTQQANTLLRIMQYDAYKDADKLVGATGNTVTQAKEYMNHHTVHNFYQQQIKRLELLNSNER